MSDDPRSSERDMTMKLTTKTTALLIFCLFVTALFPLIAFGAIEILPGGKGTLIITNPNATDPDKLITMVELGKDPVPPIPSGAVLEVFDGEFTVKITGADTVDVSILDHEMTLKEGSSVTVKSNENEGIVMAVAGDLKITDPVGEEIPVKQGASYPIKLASLEDQATEAMDSPGSKVESGVPAVDSRSMEASPSR